jgi:single-strand DNA-binding protein
MSLTITGTIKVINATQVVNDKFKKREIVITDNSNTQYPQHIICQLTQDKCSLADQFYVGDEVKVDINLRGREWTSPQGEVKYFNTIEIWKISSTTATKQPEQQSQAAQDFEAHTSSPSVKPDHISSPSDSSLPF